MSGAYKQFAVPKFCSYPKMEFGITNPSPNAKKPHKTVKDKYIPLLIHSRLLLVLYGKGNPTLCPHTQAYISRNQ